MRCATRVQLEEATGAHAATTERQVHTQAVVAVYDLVARAELKVQPRVLAAGNQRQARLATVGVCLALALGPAVGRVALQADGLVGGADIPAL